MNRELLGVVLALLASLSYESSYVLMTQQSRVVGRSGRPGGRLLVSLLRRPLWLLAIAIDGAGIVLELFALREASLIVVQPLMSVGLIGLVFAAAVFLGERIDRGTVLAAVAVATGVVCVIVAAPSDADAVRLGDGRVRRAAAAPGVPGRADRLFGRRRASRRVVGAALAATHLLQPRRGDAPGGRTSA
jgi:drug/metabolite transporter (DMT)-like permease